MPSLVEEFDAEKRTMMVAIEALGAELRATESSLAHWRTHAAKLHAQLRALRRAPGGHDETLGAPRSMLPTPVGSYASVRSPAFRSREGSFSSLASLNSRPSVLAAGGGASSSPAVAIMNSSPLSGGSGSQINWLTREFWDPKEALAVRRRHTAATIVQTRWRGFILRKRYHSQKAFFAIVSGVVELTSGGRSVPAYTITVVRGGHCWQVQHRFSDWLELDRQLAAKLPYKAASMRPSLPSRLPFRSVTSTSHRQYSLNQYLHQLMPLCEPHPTARRTLLNFLSRSHLHWTYASDAVLLAPPTAARLEAMQTRQAREAAQQMVFQDNAPLMHRTPYNGSNGGGGGVADGMNGGYERLAVASPPVPVRDTSSGATPHTAVQEPRQPARGILG